MPPTPDPTSPWLSPAALLAALVVHPMLIRLGMVFVWCLIGGAILPLAVKIAGGRRHHHDHEGEQDGRHRRHRHHHHHRRHTPDFDYPVALKVCFLASCLAILVFFVPMLAMFAAGYVDDDAPDLIYLFAAYAVPLAVFLATALFTADKARVRFGRALWITFVFFLLMSPVVAGFWILSNYLGFTVVGFEG